MAQYLGILDDLMEAFEVFNELQQVQWLGDAISETLCNGKEETKLEKVHYLFGLQWKEETRLLQELEQVLETLRQNIKVLNNPDHAASNKTSQINPDTLQ
jgi:hypothetical protein